MSEIPPKTTIEDQESAVAIEQVAEQLPEAQESIQEHAEENIVEKQSVEEKQQAVKQEAMELLQNNSNAEEKISPEQGTAFTPPTDTSEKPSWWKRWRKAAAIVGISAASVLPAKAQQGQTKTVDKAGTKTEVKSPESIQQPGSVSETVHYEGHDYVITPQNKRDWRELKHYTDLVIKKTAQAEKVSETVIRKRLNEDSFSNKVLDGFIASHKGTTVSHELVKSMQAYIKVFKKQLDDEELRLEKNHLTHSSDPEFIKKVERGEKVTPMTFLDESEGTGVDGKYGEFTSTFLPPMNLSNDVTVTVTREMDKNAKDLNKAHVTKVDSTQHKNNEFYAIPDTSHKKHNNE